MALIKIPNSTINDAPDVLSEGELAYSEKSGLLFIGLRDGEIVAIGGQTDREKLNLIAPGDVEYIWKQVDEPQQIGSPAATEGDIWYNTFTGELSILRGINWVKLTYDAELNGDFGALTMNGGYF